MFSPQNGSLNRDPVICSACYCGSGNCPKIVSGRNENPGTIEGRRKHSVVENLSVLHCHLLGIEIYRKNK